MKTSDKSKVFIIEKRMVAIQKTKNITHIVFDVFIIPKLKTNLHIIGQLQKKKKRVCSLYI